MASGEMRDARRAAFARALTLALLCALYFFSFVDRLILALLVEPLKMALDISQVQIGLLFGTAFALFYGVLGLPFARLADRINRKRLIVAGALLWGCATLASSFAESYAVLVVLRLGLAVGEAALTPAAFSLIGDLFPAATRMRAASIYSAAGMAGAGGGYVLGGWLVSWAERIGPHLSHSFDSWQLAFFAVGVPTMLFALLFALFAREPERAAPARQGQGWAAVGEVLAGRRGLAPLIVAAGLLQVPAFAMAAWMPNQLITRFGMDPARAGTLFGIIMIAGPVAGTLLLPWLSEKLPARDRREAIGRIVIASATAGILIFAGAAMLPGAAPLLICSALGFLVLTGGGNTVLTGLQHLAPPQLRATAAAICLMAFALLGMGLGPFLLALLDNAFESTRFPGGAMLTLAAISLVPAMLIVSLSRRER